MSEVLVTGANGFLGRHVARAAAAQGHRVTGMGHGVWAGGDWRSWGLSAWHDLDITLSALLVHGGTPDLIVHCAGGGSVGFSIENPGQDFERTAGTTSHVLEYLRTRSPSTALVYPSSTAVYGRAAVLPITEESPLSPISPYGTHKLIAELLCRSYGRSFGLRVSVVRIFSAYGAHLRKQLLWDASRKVLAGDFNFGGSGQEVRDWVHVEDVAALMLMAAEHATPEVPTVNGASGVGVTTREVLTMLFEALGAPQSPEFSGTSRAGDPDSYVGNPDLAGSWGWAPKHGLREGVRDYARWFTSGEA